MVACLTLAECGRGSIVFFLSVIRDTATRKPLQVKAHFSDGFSERELVLVLARICSSVFLLAWEEKEADK